MTEDVNGFRDRYTSALKGHVRGPDEAALRTAYELGREAVARELTIVDLAALHHEALIAALAESAPSEASAVTEAARDFFVESLSAFEMVARGFRDARDAALLEQRHAAVLRQLSNFLADASLALDAANSFEEMLQLVVEQARELLDATRAYARLTVGEEDGETIEALSAAEEGAAATGEAGLSAPLVAWDGRQLGKIEVFDKTNGVFGDADAAVLLHVAQMASAAVERAQLYRRLG